MNWEKNDSLLMHDKFDVLICNSFFFSISLYMYLRNLLTEDEEMPMLLWYTTMIVFQYKTTCIYKILNYVSFNFLWKKKIFF